MKRQLEKSHAGMIVFLGALLAAIWLVIVYGVYEEAKVEKYEVRVKPGTVTYGTHSTATIPTISMPTHRSSVPMISGGSVRAYAHYGHASMPKASSCSTYRLHTTSSATVHSIGSGGGSAGGSGGGSSSSSRGISYSGGSVSMPVLAMATPSRSMASMSANVTSGITTSASSLTQGTTTMESSYSASAAPARRGGIRKAKPGPDDGEEGDWKNGGGGENDWWYYDEDGWRAPNKGETRFDATLGYTVVWTGSSWVKQSEYEPGVPLGDAPWHWMVLLALSYGIVQTIKIRKQKLN